MEFIQNIHLIDQQHHHEVIIEQGEPKFNKWTISRAKENSDIRSYDNDNNLFNSEDNGKELPGYIVYEVKKLINKNNKSNNSN